MKKRSEDELPQAIQEWGWKFHHMGIPTIEEKSNENYLEQFKFSVSGFSDSPFGVEWMRFEEDCKMPELIKNIPHLAFVVDDLDFELKTRKFKILVKPNSPVGGIKVAMIEHNGSPIELMELGK